MKIGAELRHARTLHYEASGRGENDKKKCSGGEGSHGSWKEKGVVQRVDKETPWKSSKERRLKNVLRGERAT